MSRELEEGRHLVVYKNEKTGDWSVSVAGARDECERHASDRADSLRQLVAVVRVECVIEPSFTNATEHES